MLDKAHASTGQLSGTPSSATHSSMRSRPRALLPRSLKEALQLADLIHRSKLAPKGFDTPESCLVGILYGMEVGLSPIAALQRMAIIDGRPTIWGDAALALVQASGLLLSIREEIQDDPKQTIANNLTATCTVTRHGRAEPVTKTFSVEDAKRAGLWQKPGPWSDYPKRMLAMRARAFALRDAFPDVLAGLYLREEIEPATTSQQYNMEGKEQNDALPSDHPNPGSHTAKTQSDSEDHIPAPTKRRAPPPPLQHTDANTSIDANDIQPSTEDATSLITLFDDALCCAFDPETLEEIREEFQPKIDRLGSDFIEYAGRVFLRHEQRVEDINWSSSETMKTEKYLHDGLKSASNVNHQELNVKQISRRDKGPSRGSRTIRTRPITLLAFNARRRLNSYSDLQTTEHASAEPIVGTAPSADPLTPLDE